MEFRDKVIWITGASSGIGEGLAHAVASEGAHLILSGRRVEALERVQKQCAAKGAGDIEIIAFEATDFDSLPTHVSRAKDFKGRIDMLVNNAGISQRSFVTETQMSVYREIMDIDFFAPVALTKLVLPHMEQQGAGHIAVTTSIAGISGSKLRSGYCSAKHALHGFYDSLRAEVHDKGIGVTLIVPGYVHSDVAYNAITGDGSQNKKREDGHDKAMTSDEAGIKIVADMKKGKEEIYVGSGVAMMLPYLKRIAPGMLSKMIRRQQV